VIPDDVVDRVRETADIVHIIGEHVNLRRTGSDWRGPCPFHQGTHRNFSVSTKKRMYYCFVCGEGGDVFHFLQKRLGMDWPSAVRMVAEKSGIEVREVETRREGPDPREPMWEVNATAAAYFTQMLWEDPIGETAREYLAQRRVSRELGDRFGLGFAPREIGLMRSYLNTLGFDDERLLATGLLVRREEGEEPRPRFRGRLIFPIFDLPGHLAGFGGRLIGPGEPKYLNSAESPTFSKGKLLYGMNWARHAVRREDRLILVEGYFDVVRLVAAGIDEVVAPLGTAMTTEQGELIARYTKNVFLLYDSDSAGLKATFRTGDELLSHGVSVRVVTLPEGEDPDTFVDKMGREALETQIEQAVDIFDRKVQLLERAGWFADLHKRRQAVDRLLPTIRKTKDPVTRDMYIGRASEASGVDRAVLSREAGDTPPARVAAPEPPRAPAPAQSNGRGHGSPPPSADRSGRPDRSTGSARVNSAPAERDLVHALLMSRTMIRYVAERVGSESFRVPVYRELFSTLLEAGDDAEPADLEPDLSKAAVAAMQELLEAPNAIVNIQRTIDESIAMLLVQPLQARKAEIMRLISVASDAEKNALLREKQELQQKIAALRLGWRSHGRPGK
jgi:DNA primase